MEKYLPSLGFVHAHRTHICRRQVSGRLGRWAASLTLHCAKSNWCCKTHAQTQINNNNLCFVFLNEDGKMQMSAALDSRCHTHTHRPVHLWPKNKYKILKLIRVTTSFCRLVNSIWSLSHLFCYLFVHAKWSNWFSNRITRTPNARTRMNAQRQIHRIKFSCKFFNSYTSIWEKSQTSPMMEF